MSEEDKSKVTWLPLEFLKNNRIDIEEISWGGGGGGRSVLLEERNECAKSQRCEPV